MNPETYTPDEDFRQIALPPVEVLSERQPEAMERLRSKVDAVVAIQRRLEQLDTTLDTVAIDAALDECFIEVFQQFSPEQQIAFNQLLEYEGELRESIARTDDHDAYVEENLVALKADKERQKVLRHEASELMANEDVQFLHQMYQMLGSLKYKHSQLEPLYGNREALLAEVNKHSRREQIKPSDVLDVIESPFEITLVMKLSKVQKIQPGAGGLHFAGTPFSLSMQHSKQSDIIRHESIHNMVDCLPAIGRYSEEASLREAHKTYDAGAPIEERQEIEKFLADTTPARLVDALHDEILAELDNWEDKSGVITQNIFEKLDEKFDPLFYHANRYATAGNYALLITRTYTDIAHHCPDPEVAAQLDAIASQFRIEFLRAINHMVTALRQAKEQGPEAVDRVHALIFVLPPSRYRHLERFMRADQASQNNEPLQQAA